MLRALLRMGTLLLMVALSPLSLGQTPSPALAASASEPALPPPEKLRELTRLLADPELRRWIESQGAGSGRANPGAPSADDSSLEGHIDAIRAHRAALQAAVPRVPEVVAGAVHGLHAEFDAQGVRGVGLLLIVFVALGFGSEWLFWRASLRVRQTIIASRLDSTGARLRAALARLGFGSAWVAAFALGSLGAFLAFDWPPALRDVLLRLLVAVVFVRYALILGRWLFAPGAPRFRLIAMDTPAAWFWHRRLVAQVAWAALSAAFVGWLVARTGDQDVGRLVAYHAYLVQLALVLEALWRRPGGTSESARALNWLVTVALVVLLLLRVAGAFALFWLGTIVLLTVGGLRLLDALAAQVQRGPDMPSDQQPMPEVAVTAAVRGLRLLLFVLAALGLVQAWGIDPALLVAGDSLPMRLLRGALSVVVILLIADLLWFVFKASVERRMAEAEAMGALDPQAGHANRLRTVLPILRNVTLATLAVITVLMALSALGVDVAPMVAGAGVLGIAVGFGAQTLVKDIVSGMFYLFDDAFRVGEYIQSGSYKGTVEGFSLRSVRLRHHRGPVYTVPFGELGAVQNMSRDWVIDKLTVGITYDSDIERARKLIKGIGQDLAQDPEFAPSIIEPLKMQGVEAFGDFAIQIRMKMTTRPGEQFVIRRKALAKIKQAFDANGIKFAYPTVQIAGAADPATAAAAMQVAASVDPAKAKA